MTPAQLAVLKVDALANFNGVDASVAAAAYNLPMLPDYWAWKTRVTKEQYVSEQSVDGTSFDWTGAGFITRSQGERDAFQQLFMTGPRNEINPTLPQVRKALADIFSGTGIAAANRAHFLAVSRRPVTRVERLFTVVTPAWTGQSGARGATTNPDTMTFEGPIEGSDIENARASA